jgi:gluconokinase
MSNVPGLRSPYAKVGRLVYFGRMLDKIRLHAVNKLPAEYVENYSDTQPNVFDSRCCRFLGVRHAEIVKQVLAGQSDEEVLAWCHTTGGTRTDEQCDIWNMFMVKRGWRDEAHERLQMRIREGGFLGRKDIETFFDFIDADEGRDPAQSRAG